MVNLLITVGAIFGMIGIGALEYCDHFKKKPGSFVIFFSLISVITIIISIILSLSS